MTAETIEKAKRHTAASVFESKRSRIPICVLTSILLLFLSINIAQAQENELENPAYLADGSHIFWFIQISDTHVSTFFNQTYGDKLYRVATEIADTVDPWFIVTTGDLTDSTDGVVYGTGPHVEEWQEYRGYLEQAGLTPDFYFDLAGNHDAYGDGELNYYLAYSYSGVTYRTTQPYWALDMPYGRYRFAAAADSANDGQQWWWDNAIFTDWELLELEENLQALGSSEMTMIFSHHDYLDVDNNEAFSDLLIREGATFYAHGHEHDRGIRLGSDDVIRFRIDSLGQGSDNNLAVYALDNHCLSQTVVNAEQPWPLAVITAPAPAQFSADGESEWQDNPHAPPVSNSCEQAPVRVLLFDLLEPSNMRFRVDSESWQTLLQHPAIPEQWRGSFNTQELAVGIHDLEVEVTGDRTRSFYSRFRIVEGDCELGEEDSDTPLAEGEIILPETDEPIDGDGDSPEDGDQDVEAVVECVEGERECGLDNSVWICDANGSWNLLESCDEGWICNLGQCVEQLSDGDTSPDGNLPIQYGDSDFILPVADEEYSDGDMDEIENEESLSIRCETGETRCENGIFQQCSYDENWLDSRDCEAEGLQCDAARGCISQDGSGEIGSAGGCHQAQGMSCLLSLVFILFGFLIHRSRRETC